MKKSNNKKILRRFTAKSEIAMKKILLVFIFVTGFTSTPVFSQAAGGIQDKIEAIAKKYMDSLSIAGMSVSVIHNDQVKFKESFGYANLELDVPMTNQSVYRIWSVSKQFCAVSILKLEAEGRLTLEDPIHKYLDSLPPVWKNIRIAQLLNHTAGIKDYLNDYKEGEKLLGTPYEIVRDSTAVLKFPTGEDWSYSNTCYWVLAKIVESITGMQYHDYLQKEYFTPLDMPNTQKMDYFRIIKNRVNGYRAVDGIPQNSTRDLDENHVALGDADLVSTLDDLTTWAQALFSGQVIPQKQLELAWTKGKLDHGEAVNASWIIYYDDRSSYGMGWFISELDDHKIVWTPGAGRGFSTTIFSVPDASLHIIVLCNARRFLIADKMAREIATEFINKH